MLNVSKLTIVNLHVNVIYIGLYNMVYTTYAILAALYGLSLPYVHNLSIEIPLFVQGLFKVCSQYLNEKDFC